MSDCKWLNKKYQVSPESSKVLQELLFKEDVEWARGQDVVTCIDQPYLFIENYSISYYYSRVFFDKYNLEDGTQMLEEYMKGLQEQEDEWEECEIEDTRIGGATKLLQQGFQIEGKLDSWTSYLDCGDLAIQLLLKGGVVSLCVPRTTVKVFRKRPKRVTVELNGKTYYKEELEKVLSNLKEAEV